MGYIALQPMETSSGRQVETGEVVHEATKWPNLRSWVNRGVVAYVQDGKEEAFVDALKSGDDALRFAPLSRPHHVEAAARRLQYGAGVEASPLPADAPAPAAPQTSFKQAVAKRQKDG